MNYYPCPLTQLHQEVWRRDLIFSGDHDKLCERLKRDDNLRGSNATTVSTEQNPIFTFQESLRTTEFGQATETKLLVNERIVYWTMNTFFPTLQLFFASGRSCTIGSRLPNAVVGLDPELRFRLTDCSYEEDGRFFKTILPDKFAHSAAITIKEVVVAQRGSIAVRPVALKEEFRSSTIVCEPHAVVGLRLEGMDKVGYVWSKTKPFDTVGGTTWGDVRLAGLRDDVPNPLSTLPQNFLKAGHEADVVTKESMTSVTTTRKDSVISDCRRHVL